MKLLITGGLGYVGARVAQYLSTLGHEIYLGTRQAGVLPNCLSHAHLVTMRWAHAADLNHACKQMDVVIHAAGMNAADCLANPEAALQFNGVGTLQLLQAAIRQGVKRFIYLSTAHVYGNPLAGTISEKTPINNKHPYAASHRAGEQAVLSAHLSKAILGIVIRLANTYGAPAFTNTNCWSLYVNDLCRQAVSTHKMVIRSSGNQRRDFIALVEVGRAIAWLLSTPPENLDDGVFNLGGQWSPTLWDMACLIKKRCEVVLQCQPELCQSELGVAATDLDLDYRMDRLLQLGFKPNADRFTELDQLLSFCRDADQ